MNLRSCRDGRFCGLAALGLIFLTSVGRVVAGQEAPPTKGEKKAIQVEEMRDLVTPFRITEVAPAGGGPVKLEHEPIARWNDPTRDFSDGSLWLWTRNTVPIAAVAVELYPNRQWGASWAYEFVSLSVGRFELSGGDGFTQAANDLPPPRPDGAVWWAPGRPGVEFRQVTGAPVPGRSAAERLRQAKTLLKRFNASETYHEQTYTLRPLPHPVHRFADESGGVLDGAVFLLANGTNPEIVFLLEARRRSDGSVAWEYAAAPLGRARLSVSLDRQVVWTFPVTAVAGRDATYFLARKPRAPESGEANSPSGARP